MYFYFQVTIKISVNDHLLSLKHEDHVHSNNPAGCFKGQDTPMKGSACFTFLNRDGSSEHRSSLFTLFTLKNTDSTVIHDAACTVSFH